MEAAPGCRARRRLCSAWSTSANRSSIEASAGNRSSRPSMPKPTAGVPLVAHIDFAGRIVADQHGGQAGDDAVVFDEVGDFFCQLRLDLSAQRLAVQNRRAQAMPSRWRTAVESGHSKGNPSPLRRARRWAIALAGSDQAARPRANVRSKPGNQPQGEIRINGRRPDRRP